ncbi:MAG TPA: hypothetical protein VKT78_09415, partial [Fimbriimonadaceae bacterium]|nr:hypothetical protein [Fimbriimonadaceae bacterium]
GYENLPYAYLRVSREARLAHTHWNSQPLGNYDQDLNVGVINWQDTEALLYALKMIGYDEFFTFDINPERMPANKAIEINAKVLRIMNERIDALPHDRLMNAFYDPAANRGVIEEILADSFATKRC